MNSLKEQYDLISKAFSETRKKHLWPELLRYLAKLKSGDRLLDLGAGSGRLYRHVPAGVEYIGVDISPGMLEEAKKDHPSAAFFEADILHVHSLDKLGQFDYVFVIAVAHHLDDKELKKLFSSILKRLKPDGIAILSCWRLLSSKYFRNHLNQIFNKIKKANWRFLEIPFYISDGRNIVKTINRTCYAYDILKLKTMATKAGLKIVSQSKTSSNIWLEMQRSSNFL